MESVKAEEVHQKGVSIIKGLVLLPDNETHSQLWRSWHFLQVYSIWGLRLPPNELELKASLSMDNPGLYSFFPLMLEGNQQIIKKCDRFQKIIFPQVISLAEGLFRYAKLSSPEGLNLFDQILQLIEDKKYEEAKLNVIALREYSLKNKQMSIEVKEILKEFSSDISNIKILLDECHKKIEEQEEISSSFINTAMGDVNTEGSLGYLQKQVDDLLAEYNHAKIVAATTPSYAWVFLYGLIAAVVVAAVFGPKAVDLLKKYNQAKAKLDQENQSLRTALTIRNSLKLSNDQIIYMIDSTTRAIEHTSNLEEAWNEIDKSLEDLISNVDKLIIREDEQETVAAISFVVSFCVYSKKVWAELIEPLNALVSNPYIEVQEGNQSLSQISDEIEKEIKNQEINRII